MLPLSCHTCLKKAKGLGGYLQVFPFIAVILYTINEERKGKDDKKHALPICPNESMMLMVFLALHEGYCNARNDGNPFSPSMSFSSVVKHEQRSNLHAFPS